MTLITYKKRFVGDIDTDEIIHRIRARYSWGDSPSQIGDRLIVAMSRAIVDFEGPAKMSPLPKPADEKVYKNKDYTEESVAILYRNFESGLIERYLSEKADRCSKGPILTNPVVEPDRL